MHGQIDHEIEISIKLDNASMVNLRYLRKVLNDHISRLTETILVLKCQDQFAWPRAAPGSVQRDNTDSMRSILLSDFSYLCHRAEELSTRCQKGMQSLVNAAAFEESAKGVANAERVEQLTFLATIFVPLSFTCSAFRMNFETLDKVMSNSGSSSQLLPELWHFHICYGFVPLTV